VNCELSTLNLRSARFTLGVDFGTNSVRAIVCSLADGRIVGTTVFGYPSGEQGVLLLPGDPELARQNPADYVEGLRASVTGALAEADRDPSFARDRVIGIGVDTTGSTPLPIDAQAQPLAFSPRWKDHLAAQARRRRGCGRTIRAQTRRRPSPTWRGRMRPGCWRQSAAPTRRSGGGRRSGAA
jgi:sugar (pentulose or hexulose) kinase